MNLNADICYGCCCCPASRIRWSTTPKRHFGGLVRGNWPWCLAISGSPAAQGSSQRYQPKPQIAHVVPHRRNFALTNDFIVEMEISPNTAPLWIMCLISVIAIPFAPLLFCCVEDYALAWHFHLNPDNAEDLQLLIRRKNKWTEEVIATSTNLNCIFLEHFEDYDPDTELSVWKQRLVITTMTEQKMTSIWYIRTPEIHNILDQIYRTVSTMIPASVRVLPPPAPSHLINPIPTARRISPLVDDKLVLTPATIIVETDNTNNSDVNNNSNQSVILEEGEEKVEEAEEATRTTTNATQGVTFSIPNEIVTSGLWDRPLHELVTQIREEFSFPSGLRSIEVIERGCLELGITPTSLQKVDAIAIVMRLQRPSAASP